jgi:hypothetical protein
MTFFARILKFEDSNRLNSANPIIWQTNRNEKIYYFVFIKQ